MNMGGFQSSVLVKGLSGVLLGLWFERLLKYQGCVQNCLFTLILMLWYCYSRWVWHFPFIYFRAVVTIYMIELICIVKYISTTRYAGLLPPAFAIRLLVCLRFRPFVLLSTHITQSVFKPQTDDWFTIKKTVFGLNSGCRIFFFPSRIFNLCLNLRY